MDETGVCTVLKPNKIVAMSSSANTVPPMFFQKKIFDSCIINGSLADCKETGGASELIIDEEFFQCMQNFIIHV